MDGREEEELISCIEMVVVKILGGEGRRSKVEGRREEGGEEVRNVLGEGRTSPWTVKKCSEDVPMRSEALLRDSDELR